MKLEFSNELNTLAKIFKKHDADLFVVGGYVRNALLGFCETDIDICSKLTAEELSKYLNPKKYTLKIVNEKLGTVHIYINGTQTFYEHTTFRAEVYSKGGNHSPKVVRFVDDIPLDASRRDFTINAIYCNVLTGQLVDFYNGASDTLNHVIRTVETPEYVFNRDGLRILRLVRFACELNFTIEEHTLEVAQSMVSQLADVSQERFNKEIVAILFADYKYEAIESTKAHIHGIKLLSTLKAWEYVFPKFTKIVGKGNMAKLYEENWVRLLVRAPPSLRITALVYDIFKHLKVDMNRKNIFALLGNEGLMLNKKECERQYMLLSSYNEIQATELHSDEQCRIFLQKVSAISHNLIALCQLNHSNLKLQRNFWLMQTDHIPLTKSDLDINGHDIEKAYPQYKKQYYSQIFDGLLTLTAIMPEINKKAVLLKEVEIVYDKIQKQNSN